MGQKLESLAGLWVRGSVEGCLPGVYQVVVPQILAVFSKASFVQASTVGLSPTALRSYHIAYTPTHPSLTIAL